MPIIIKGKLTNLSEKQIVKPEVKIKQPSVTTLNKPGDNSQLKKIDSAKHSFFNTTIEGEKKNWTKSDYLVDILSEE